SASARGGQHRLEERLAQQLDIACAFSEAVGAEVHLQWCPLSGYVEPRAATLVNAGGDLKQDRRLSDARLAAHEHHGTGHDAATEHEVELAQACADALGLRASDMTEPGRGRNRTARA